MLEFNEEISIHAPRVGSDRQLHKCFSCRNISIHAPRVGSDVDTKAGLQEVYDFNPRSPCGERLTVTRL